MKHIDIVIETPKGSAQKYDYDPQTHFFKLKKILPAGMVFPFDFGFIPGTKGEDGDPLDIIIISDLCSFPGCLMECRIIGGITAKQTSSAKNKMIRNDRYLGVPPESVLFKRTKSLKDLPPEIMKEIEDFFIDYNKIQNKEFKVTGLTGAAHALDKILKNKKLNK
jgi:inorganic pyrophosphatase